MRPSFATPFPTSDCQLAGFSNETRYRPPMEPDELLIAGAMRLCDRADLPLSIRKDLHTLKQQTRRVAANRSAFAALVRAAQYATHPADALWFPRLIESEAFGRGEFPTLSPDIAHEAESQANHELDVAQIRHRERRTASTLEALLDKALVQEVATKMLAATEASEMRVKSVLMRAGL